jgi:hypothetical protein
MPRGKAVDDAKNAASLLNLGQYNLRWIGSGAEYTADLRNRLDRIQHIDRVEAIAQENDEAVARREGQHISACENNCRSNEIPVTMTPEIQ